MDSGQDKRITGQMNNSTHANQYINTQSEIKRNRKMTFITQPIPEEKKVMIQALCDAEGPNYILRTWSINTSSSSFLLCLSWETGRGDPRSPGLWLYVQNDKVIRLRVMANEDWGPHIDGIHIDFDVIAGYWDGAKVEAIKPIQQEIKEALLSMGLSKARVTKVTVSFTDI